MIPAVPEKPPLFSQKRRDAPAIRSAPFSVLYIRPSQPFRGGTQKSDPKSPVLPHNINGGTCSRLFPPQHTEIQQNNCGSPFFAEARHMYFGKSNEKSLAADGDPRQERSGENSISINWQGASCASFQPEKYPSKPIPRRKKIGARSLDPFGSVFPISPRHFHSPFSAIPYAPAAAVSMFAFIFRFVTSQQDSMDLSGKTKDRGNKQIHPEHCTRPKGEKQSMENASDHNGRTRVKSREADISADNCSPRRSGPTPNPLPGPPNNARREDTETEPIPKHKNNPEEGPSSGF